MHGTIKKIIQDRGFGFISAEDEEDDLFFHRSEVQGDLIFEELKEGQVVIFEVEETFKGPQAVNIKSA